MPKATLSDADILGVLDTINHSVNEHQRQMQDVTQLARQARVEPQKPAIASTLENMHQEAVEELRDNVGVELRQVVHWIEITMHQQAVKLIKDAVDWVNDEQFKRFLREAVPDLQSHLEAAQSIQRRFK
jgi:predicted outer membrane protein